MKKILALLLFVGASALYAQQKTHTVQAKETVYGISKQYGVSQEELYKANPKIEKNGIHPGDLIVIPTKGTATNQPTETNNPTQHVTTSDDNYQYITIEPKETVYNLTKKYSISEETLYSLNPQIKERGLEIGDVIKLPKVVTNKVFSVPKGTHLIKKGETLYTLAKQYNVSVDDFYAENPALQTGVKEGMVISIPKKSGSVTIEENSINYIVQNGDSAYGILERYNTNLDELLRLNPELINGLKAGMTLKIPLQKNAKIIKYGTAGKLKRANDNEINVAILLPFDVANNPQLKNSQAMQFFTGTKLALTRLAKKGKNVNVKVVDTKDGNLQDILSTTDFSKTDAVIGPLNTSDVTEVANFFSNSGIAVISPYANDDSLNSFNDLLISNPKDEVIADQIIDEIGKNFAGEQVYLLTNRDDQELANYTKKQLEKQLKANVVIVDSASKIVQPHDKVNGEDYYTPIITVLVGDDDALGKQYLEKLKTFHKDNIKAYGIKAVSVYDVYNPENAKNIDAFREFGFVFSTARLINTRDTEVQSVLKDFKDVYCEFPTRYEQIGYDVTYDIVDRMNNKGDVTNNITTEYTRVASKFAYKKASGSKAFTNDASRIVRLPKK
ncbi:LysM peptidoglycan-binding domain-containing protein [Empedobacter falsenii]|uniref:LysM peptidoglycan-binding domain-containing protein n=1 Tax=Empedobacter stercoris TaxID=1628248 RepID=A0ABX1WKN2_9FLAO|nr:MULTISPECIES: LysM peptidoglycan-binding domain-containing protein [Empedobacter]MCA4775531.1 LysM peptidoglycan-binding domain-containing protein [Empedobacter stercoris]MDM1522560.1 LysM peptidoglycan-binding domain-containing protein [Empedobacter sp. 225-1]MDM1542750.1 LysM peptidoglycan-binding domain-containing protein [Empedobacter sp. 189-2]NOJ75236.1 LysM peptidoglycan-binding domain-containing protein [Empedobacter stercoris]